LAALFRCSTPRRITNWRNDLFPHIREYSVFSGTESPDFFATFSAPVLEITSGSGRSSSSSIAAAPFVRFFFSSETPFLRSQVQETGVRRGPPDPAPVRKIYRHGLKFCHASHFPVFPESMTGVRPLQRIQSRFFNSPFQDLATKSPGPLPRSSPLFPQNFNDRRFIELS